jgi:hypothetical protein
MSRNRQQELTDIVVASRMTWNQAAAAGLLTRKEAAYCVFSIPSGVPEDEVYIIPALEKIYAEG